MTPAPYFDDIAAEAPAAKAYWVEADDNVRLRVAHWPAQTTAKGTILLFPGRTEYIEKYALAAEDFAQQGMATLAIDWRGQGLGQRLLPDALVGHVEDFRDYQRDVRAMVSAADALNLPKPFYLLGHSMGGCIGLRALYEGLPVAAAAFTGPMWGIRIANAVRPAAWAVSWTTKIIGLGHMYAPSTGAESYVATQPFEGNMLTRDAGMFDWMRNQVVKHPELQLGGPSLRWLHEALVETRLLSMRPAPNLPCLTILGDNERIVSTQRIRNRMKSWPKGHLHLQKNGEHEVLMEDAATRKAVSDKIATFLLNADTPSNRAKQFQTA